MRGEPEIAMIVLFGSGALFLIVWVLASYCSSAFKTWVEVGLKRDMVARGYTAQEIVQVVAARKGSRPKDSKDLTDIPPAKPVRNPAYG